MRLLPALVVASLLAVLAAPSGAPTPSAAAPAPASAASSAVAPAPRPGIEGRFLVDQQGRVLVLHGVNMVYKRPPYAPDAIGFGADDARFLVEQGFTTVRLGLIWKAVEPRPGRYDNAYLFRIRQTTKVLAAAGIHVMLDFHQDLYNERFQGEGAPDWAVQDDGLPAEPKLGFPYNYFGQLALNRAFDHFWANAPGPGGVGLQDRYAAAWAHVASYFKGTRGVMGFDLFNEPWPGTVWPTCVNPLGCPGFDSLLQAFSQRGIDAIRAVDSEDADLLRAARPLQQRRPDHDDADRQRPGLLLPRLLPDCRRRPRGHSGPGPDLQRLRRPRLAERREPAGPHR